jgi:hypothetical protein
MHLVQFRFEPFHGQIISSRSELSLVLRWNIALKERGVEKQKREITRVIHLQQVRKAMKIDFRVEMSGQYTSHLPQKVPVYAVKVCLQLVL